MKQIQVNVGTNTSRERHIHNSTDTVREIVEAHRIDYSRGTVHIDGSPLMVGEMDKSLEQLGITGDKCNLVVVVKADGAR